jgi:hypothetical protein
MGDVRANPSALSLSKGQHRKAANEAGACEGSEPDMFNGASGVQAAE